MGGRVTGGTGAFEAPAAMLTPHVRARGCAPDQAAVLAGRVFADHQLRLMQPDGFDFALHANRIGSMSVARISFGTSVAIRAEGPVGKLIFGMVGAGHADMSQRGARYALDAGRVWASTPGVPVSISSSRDFDLSAVFVRPSAVRDHLGQLLGHEVTREIVFAAADESSSGIASVVAMLSRALADTAEQTFLPPLVTAHLDQLTLTTLLLSYPHSYSEQLHWHGTPGTPRTVRVVEHALRDRPEYPWTIGELAQRAKMSGRAVQLAFQKHVGMSPFDMLRQIRLERAHEDLLNPIEGDTVTAIAQRWGFSHLGRFAAAYKRRYQVAPSETLRRSR
ncbi:AraC family transcriptional regulator [Streptomyces sp. NPDC091217]|uniref:helix-turn-helix transcriptional regulator n=1 Tax=Streptomyces sp. NPDC091217 TaxID=3365975 RepID=UPI00380C1A9E